MMEDFRTKDSEKIEFERKKKKTATKLFGSSLGLSCVQWKKSNRRFTEELFSKKTGRKALR